MPPSLSIFTSSPPYSCLTSTLLRPHSLTKSLIRHNSISSTAITGSLINVRTVPAPGTGSIRILSLHNPKARNAISRALLAELSHHVVSIHDEGPRGPTRALILASDVDAAFCAGADLKERRGFTQKETATFLHDLRKTLSSISTLPIPTLSAISSVALGGGLELALTTHLRIFASSATVGLPETRLAIIPGAGGTYRLPAIIGRNRALDLMLTGRRVGGAEAYHMGMCNRLVDVGHNVEEGLEAEEKKERAKHAREAVLKVAVETAMGICEGGPKALRSVVRACGKGEEVENEEYEKVVETWDRNEALEAFREKRRPVFRGV